MRGIASGAGGEYTMCPAAQDSLHLQIQSINQSINQLTLEIYITFQYSCQKGSTPTASHSVFTSPCQYMLARGIHTPGLAFAVT
jgi:hypothetical protein